MKADERCLHILTWQVHGNYLWYLSQVPHQWWIVTAADGAPGYPGRSSSFPWGDNVREIALDQVRHGHFDAVLYQSRQHWDNDRHALLSHAQRTLPSLYLEHDPPQEHPTNTRHWAADEVDLLIQVSPFNALMWDTGPAFVQVIEHAAWIPPGVRYSGELKCGLSVINHLCRRGRRLGADLFERLRSAVPLELAGMESERMVGGIGEIPNVELPRLMSRYRFLLNPARWTSLSLAVVEAMNIGMPVVGFATTEMSTVICNGRNGWLATNPDELLDIMRLLLSHHDLAYEWGLAARCTALTRFGKDRFIGLWKQALRDAVAIAQSRRHGESVYQKRA